MSRSVVAHTGDDLTPPGGMNLPGSRLRILDRISDGGCGVVYRGEHVDLQRAVAIKVSRSDALSTGARELFLDEARTTTRIESPYVVQVVDFGELPDGRVWYAMEHLGGRALDQMIANEGRISAARAVTLLRMACKGLAAAHAAGVVHRDVKPQNLVVIARGGREHLVLVDFGIALPCGTRPAVVSGTPEYMAREQILRDVLDERTDVYGLGCVAYEMLTGLPIVAGSSVQQALLMHSEGIDPDFPEALEVPAPLQELVRRCLAVDPAHRFANMAELEAALCEAQIAARLPQVREDLELPIVEPTRRRRIADGFLALARPQRRLPTRAAIFSSSLIAAVLGLVIAWPQQPSAAESVAPMATAAAVSTTIAIDPVEPVVVAAPMTVVAEEPSEPVLAATTNVAAIAPAPVIRSATIGPTARVVETPRVAVPREPLARSAVKDGRRALRRGDRVVAEQAFRRAMQLDPRSSSAAAGLADVYFERGEHDRAMHFAKIAVQRAPQSPAHRVRLGDAYYRLARYADARAEYETAKRMGSTIARRRVVAMEHTAS